MLNFKCLLLFQSSPSLVLVYENSEDAFDRKEGTRIKLEEEKRSTKKKIQGKVYW